MITFKRTDSSNTDFQTLIVELDRYLAIMDGDEHAFYAQYNKSDGLKYVVLAYDGETPVGCGALKTYSENVMEVKRMYVDPRARGQGVAASILEELENWAVQLSHTDCVLETGVKQLAAIRLYQKSGYKMTPNYGQYQGLENSLCFAKALQKAPK
jgi:GNAT superfamily N-acetyltransferase